MANEFFTNEYTAVIQKLVMEIVNDPSTYLGAKYLPSVAVPSDKIRTEVIEASGGLTKEHTMGTDPKAIQRPNTRVQEFSGGTYKETLIYDEKDILHLRRLGKNDTSQRGIRQYLDMGIDRLNRRIEARIEYERWQNIFNGGFTFLGRTFSFGIPAANQTVPLGAVWSTDSINANNSANPIADIRYWVTGGLDAFRKYKIKKMVMNPNTARWIMENTNTKSYLSSIGANPSMNEWSLQRVMDFLIPAGPAVEVYEGWYQSESVDSDGKISVGDATYFIPDGKIFFEATLPGGDMIGEFVQGIHLASGSIDDPGYGKFLVVEECIAPGTRGGPKNPFIEVVGGVYGQVNLYRSFDTLTANVL